MVARGELACLRRMSILAAISSMVFCSLSILVTWVPMMPFFAWRDFTIFSVILLAIDSMVEEMDAISSLSFCMLLLISLMSFLFLSCLTFKLCSIAAVTMLSVTPLIWVVSATLVAGDGAPLTESAYNCIVCMFVGVFVGPVAVKLYLILETGTFLNLGGGAA